MIKLNKNKMIMFMNTLRYVFLYSKHYTNKITKKIKKIKKCYIKS